MGQVTGWYQLENLMIKIGALDKAEEIYQKLLQSTKSDIDMKEFCMLVFLHRISIAH